MVWGVVEAIISPRIGLTFGHKDDLSGGMTRKGHRWRTHIYKHADTRRDTPRHAAAPQHTCAPIQTHAHEPTHPRAIAPASAHAPTCPHAHTLPARRPNPKCPCYLGESCTILTAQVDHLQICQEAVQEAPAQLAGRHSGANARRSPIRFNAGAFLVAEKMPRSQSCTPPPEKVPLKSIDLHKKKKNVIFCTLNP